MTKNRVGVGLLGLVIGIATCVVFACGGSDGTNGAPGAAGSAGPAGSPGSPGAAGPSGANGTGTGGTAGEAGAQGDAGGTVIISATAKRGLDISPVPLTLAGLSGDQIERIGQGSYLVNAMGDCGGCHNTPGPTLKFLGGGVQFGPVASRNLTPGTFKLTEAQFLETIRTGKDQSADAGAQALIVMPWETFRWMSTADLKAIWAYLQVIPAVANTVAADTKPAVPPLPSPTTFNEGVVTRPLPPEVDAQNMPLPDPNNVLRGLAIVPVDLGPPNNATPGQIGQFGRGSYIVNAVADCSGCHSNPPRIRTSPVHAVNTAQYLSGGQVFVTPPPLQALLRTTRAMSENLVGQARGFFNGTDQSVTPARPVDFTTFLRLITQGVHADDPLPPMGLQRPLGFPMPYDAFRKMTLEDLEAVYLYVNEVAGSAAAPSGPANDKVTQDPSIYCAANSDCAVGSCNMTAHECVGAPCNPSSNVPNTNTDCPVCQQCVSGACVAPDVSGAGTPGSLCIARGL